MEHFVFQSVLEEMGNVLKYIDDENISQMVLQMSEQVRVSNLSFHTRRFKLAKSFG